MIPFDTWDRQSMSEKNFLIKYFDLQMTLNYDKKQHNMLTLFQAFRKGK